MKKKGQKDDSDKAAKRDPNAVSVPVKDGEDPDEKSTQIMMGPYVSNAAAMMAYSKRTMADAKIGHVMTALLQAAKKVRNDDMSDVEATLVSQAMTLNVMFGDLSTLAKANLSGGYIEAGERYLRLALKAQSQSRATLETLSTIKNPPVVYAKQANIAHGPQQVNNGTSKAPRAGESGSAPNKLLATSDEQSLDNGASSIEGRWITS